MVAGIIDLAFCPGSYFQAGGGSSGSYKKHTLFTVQIPGRTDNAD
jgi:hypothetical protein